MFTGRILYNGKPLQQCFHQINLSVSMHYFTYMNYQVFRMSTGLLFVNKSFPCCRLCTVWMDCQASHLTVLTSVTLFSKAAS